MSLNQELELFIHKLIKLWVYESEDENKKRMLEGIIVDLEVIVNRHKRF